MLSRKRNLKEYTGGDWMDKYIHQSGEADVREMAEDIMMYMTSERGIYGEDLKDLLLDFGEEMKYHMKQITKQIRT